MEVRGLPITWRFGPVWAEVAPTMLDARTQEGLALAIVAGVVLALAWRLSRGVVGPPLARWLLKRGHVKAAMRVRRWSGSNCCD